MSVVSVRAALVDACASAVSARVKHTSMPQAMPQSFPAVYVSWVRSSTLAQSFQLSNTMQSKRRTHTYDVVVFVSGTNNAPASDTSLLNAVDNVVASLESDTLADQGHVEVVEITPYTLTDDTASLIGCRATVEVTEWL